MNHIKLLLFIAVMLSFAELHAQSATVATGGVLTTSSASISYSIGQVFYQPVQSDQISVVAGVQHAYQVITLASPDPIALSVLSIFPNPTTSYLTLKTDLSMKDQRYQVFNLEGKTVLEGAVRSELTDIGMQLLPEGIYLINVISTGHLLQSFKVIKK